MTHPTAAALAPTRAWRRLLASMALGAAVGVAGVAGAAEPAAKAQQPAAKPAKPAATPAARSPEPAAPAPGTGKPIEPLLSREELRDCMDRQARLREASAQARVLQAELEREKSEILRDGEALKAELGTLDRSDAAAVASYNSRASARDRRIDAFEPRVAEFNARGRTMADDQAAFLRLCENRKFDERDEKALQKP